MTLLTIFHKATEELPHKGINYIQENGEQIFRTYRELKEAAAKILGGYRELGLKPGNKVILALSSKEEFILAFWGCILGGIIPVPLPAPTSLKRANPQQSKLEQVAKFLDYPTIILDKKLLTQNSFTNIPQEQLFTISHLQSNKVATAFHQPSSQDLALIQFSSGTTGTPKGVCLTHQNILTNLAAMKKGMELLPEDIVLSWLPLSHDMGLIGFHLVPLYMGNNQFHLDTLSFIKYPFLWLESIEKYRATITAAPNFSQALILERLKRQPDKKYNLASIRLLFNGAEPIAVDLMTRFMAEMGAHGLKSTAMFPVYGLAEATLAVTFPPLGQTPKIETLSRQHLQNSQEAVISQEAEEVISFVSVGVPVSGCQIRIVGEEGHVGEIQIKGENVTKGYYNREPAPEWLATGDLGYLRDGWLYVTGRSKDIIFLHGQNYYAHDLENVACQVPGVKLGRIALWGSFDEKLGRDKVLLFLRGEAELFWQVQQHLRRITGLEIDVMIPLKSFPKTSSGKLQRYKLGEQFAAGEFTQVSQEMAQLLAEVKAQRRQKKIAPRTFTEKLLHRVWCEELLLAPEDVGIEDSFMELGGNSLRMAFVVQKLAKQYQVYLDEATWAEYPTIRELAVYLDQHSTRGVKTRGGVFKG